MRRVQVIPMEELKRPRVDVVVNCSGVFRDLFINQVPPPPPPPCSTHDSIMDMLTVLHCCHFRHGVS